MKNQIAFESCKAAFEAMANNPGWTKQGVPRPEHVSPLGVFIGSRDAVWVEPSDLEQLRASQPRLRPLPGIKSRVYGLRFRPGCEDVYTSPFLCLCPGCSTWPRTQCAYPLLCPETKQAFHIVAARVITVTVPRLKAFLVVHGKPRSGNKPALVARAAPLFDWSEGEQPADPEELLVAVSNKIVEFEAEQLAVLEKGREEALKTARNLEELKERLLKAQEDLASATVSLSNPAAAARPPLTPAVSESKRSSARPPPTANKTPLSNTPAAAAHSSLTPAVSESKSPSADPPPAAINSGRKQAKRSARVVQPSSPKKARLSAAGAAQIIAQDINVGRTISLYFNDAGWCDGVVSSVSGKGIEITWPCDDDTCPTRTAVDVLQETCPHGKDGDDGRQLTAISQRRLALDLQKGEIRLLESSL